MKRPLLGHAFPAPAMASAWPFALAFFALVLVAAAVAGCTTPKVERPGGTGPNSSRPGAR